MKTTIDLDEAKLERVMALTGITTRKEAIEFALTEAERIARIHHALNEPFYVVREEEPVIDPTYDVRALRGMPVIRS
jgi:hypothetical protein